MQIVTRLALCLLALAAVSPVGAQVPDLSNVTIATTPLGNGMYMLEASGDVAGNIAVSVGADGVLIVDDQWRGLARQILESLRELHGGSLRFILNTHHHDDHSDGNAVLSAATGATVVAHANVRARLMHKQAEHWPTVTYSDRMALYFNGEKIEVLAMPGGHTDNDSIVIFSESNVVHLGDLFNSGRTSFPLADLSAGGNALRILENVRRILPLIPMGARIIAGHGPLSDRVGLVDFQEMLASTIDFVQKRRAGGISLAAIRAAGLPAAYDDWNHGYTSAAEWIEMIYRSIDIYAK